MIGDFKDLGLKDFLIKKITGSYNAKEFWAVNDISFSLEKGDFLGIVGTNGAGKSTLLKTISGIMQPQKGSYTVDGNIAALLELGTGFDKNMTLRENIFLRGALLGYTEEFMKKMSDNILEFAELKKFENRTYGQLSSGMKSRLAFSISCLVEPDVLILDEVLSVGDASFRKKSEKKLFEIINSGATTILVTHSISQVRRLCNKVLWLNKGQQIAFGETSEICDMYEHFLSTGKIENVHKDEVSKDEEKIPEFTKAQRYDTGIITRIFDSYSSIISNYALYKALENLDASVVILDNLVEIEGISAKKFAEDNMRLGTVIELESNAASMNKYFNGFMVGPCNGWEIHNSYNLKNNANLHIDFADISTKTISAYGVSYNGRNFDFEMPINKIKYSLLKQRFDYIGLCEDYAVNATSNIFNADCELVINPVFLLTDKAYHDIAVRSTCRESEPYILVYMLNYSESCKEYILWLADSLKLKPVIIIDNEASIAVKNELKESFDNILHHLDIYDWLYYIENSRFVITDEFSCTCLAIIYHKDFVVFKNNHDDRLTLLGNQLGISDRIFESVTEASDIPEPVQYDKVDKILEEYIKIGYRFLTKTLASPCNPESAKNREDADKALKSLKTLTAGNNKYKSIQKKFGYLDEINSEIKNIQNKLNITYLEAVYKYYSITVDNPEFAKLISVSNAVRYFSELDAEKYIIFMAVRGETGKHGEKLLKTAGFPVSIKPEAKNNAIIIIDSGKVVFEQSDNGKIMHNYNVEEKGLYAFIISSNKTESNCADIMINNIDYSMNMSGFNIVLYDKSEKCVIDTFNINTCKDEYLYLNRKK